MDFIIKRGQKIRLGVDEQEPEAVKIAASNLACDLERALGIFAEINDACREDSLPEIVIGTLGVSHAIQGMVDSALLCDEKGTLRKEAYLHCLHEGRLVIAGSDRRGTIYGIYDLCEALGVSPWHFWADVPVKTKQEFVLPQGYQKMDYPSVEYRGIFINDEEELEAWVQNYMGEPTIGVKTYEKVFELLLRLKANYIWPAMHVNSFNLTPENGALAERMGIVVGTSHCDMLMRSNYREWKPWTEKKGYTDAVYDYSIEGRNREILKEYWRESVEQNRDYEVCYTLGMRGIHDSGFETRELEGRTEEEIRSAKIALLEKIIADQRAILRETLGHETMMTFVPYKEVLELYDNGLEVPEDMTLVWANDNYGYIRRYPSEREKRRRGGNGIYYHNSYWAPPSMSCVFLCSIPLAHTRNELQKAWDEGIRKLWVLNSGAMKPLEQEISFFLQLAWEIGKPGALTEDVEAWVEDWANRTFTGGRDKQFSIVGVKSAHTDSCDAADTICDMGEDTSDRSRSRSFGKEVSRLLNDFSQLTNVRKLENMDYDAFSQTAYGDEAAVRIHQYEELFARGNALYERLPEEEKDAFFQLVLMRVHAAYFTNLAFYYGDRSTLMYDRGNMQAARHYTEKSREAEDARRKLLHYYNRVMCGGKWEGILNPEGYPPPRAAMMPLCTPPLEIKGEPVMDIHVWNEGEELCFASPGEKWIDIGNKGTGEFRVRMQAPEWVTLSEEQFSVSGEKRIMVSVPDVSADRGGELVAENMCDGRRWRIPVRTIKPEYVQENCALEEDGLVVLEAGQFLSQSRDFCLIPRLGRMRGDLVQACARGALRSAEGQGTDISEIMPLCYRFMTRSSGEFLLEIHRFPSLNSVGRIRVGVSLDNGPVQIAESFSNDEWRGNWKKNVLNNVDRLYLRLSVDQPGLHRLYVWAMERYFAFSRLVIYTRPRKENNLAGLWGAQPLPAEWDMSEWCDDFYGAYDVPPRSTFYAASTNDRDCVAVTCQVTQAEHYGQKLEPRWYLERGKHIFEEADGAIQIDAAAALAQSSCAWTGQQDTPWRHCGSESFGRSGLAMYIRKPEESLDVNHPDTDSRNIAGQPVICRKEESFKLPDAPSLNYRIRCRGGEYTLWMLSKFNMQEEGFFAVGFDGGLLSQESLYGNGGLWRYEAEQIYCWVPVACKELKAGEHVLQIYALASGMRYDRFYLTTGEEKPPLDTGWIRKIPSDCGI